ncbi:hypothetical protein [Bradyrhizobium sp. Y36]|uniref:hypothetical protein n=1 Tax=Bradyrhizobium sp. Y36 TaxID=2035447 RepID=UPI0018E9D5A7|nr:hypothetical protein [Bradyrhizobium sp. Y36]
MEISSRQLACGTDAQKMRAADLVLGGDKPAICITEPDAGNDASGMTTRADKRGNRSVEAAADAGRLRLVKGRHEKGPGRRDA